MRESKMNTELNIEQPCYKCGKMIKSQVALSPLFLCYECYKEECGGDARGDLWRKITTQGGTKL